MASDLPPVPPSPTSHDAHEYLPAEVVARLPRLGTTEGTPDPFVQVKYFTPDSSWTWFAIEFDPDDGVFFGLVDGLEEELGYFSLAELQEARGPHGLRIERDLWFSPKPLSAVRRR